MSRARISLENSVGGALFLQFGVAIVLTLRFGLHRSWSESVIATACFVVLPIAFGTGMVLVISHRIDRMRAISLAVALFVISDAAAVIYFASRWGLVTGGALWFGAIIMIVTTTTSFFLPRRWKEHIGEIKCTACHHYHEGHDCKCGCSAARFKYPAFPAPI